MHIEKILETCVDLLTPDEIYSADIDNLILNKLTERYANNCYQSIYILKITQIIKRSSIRMSSVRLDGGASIDVQFRVVGIILMENEILHGCKIEQIHDYAITASHEYVGIKLQKNIDDVKNINLHNQLMQILKIGQIIPVVVKQVRYLTNKKQISIIAVPYTPSIIMEAPYYYITNGLSKEQLQKVEFLINMIKDEQHLHDKLQTQRQYKFFQDLMYPYKTNKQFGTKSKLKPVKFDMEAIKNVKSGFLTYPLEENRASGCFFAGEENHINTNIKNADLYTIITSFCNEYLQYLLALRGFVTTYESTENIKPLLTYFKICRHIKAD